MPNPTRIGQRFVEGDRVSKRRIDNFKTNRPRRTGNVVEVIEEMKKIKNRNPFKHYSYKVLWDDLKSPSLHAQQTLQALDDQTKWDVEMPEPKSSNLDAGDCGQFQNINLKESK